MNLSLPGLRLPSPLVELHDDRLGSVRVLLKRDDLIHRTITGNKWRKLKYLLPEVRATGARTLLTFGGPYSNHLRAVAAVGRAIGLRTVGVVRGEERPFNGQLADAVADGMHLHYVDRATYRRKANDDVLARLHDVFGEFFLVPEGGTTVHAVPGCAEIIQEIEPSFDVVLTAVGTGGTLAGVAAGLQTGQRAIGVSVLKGANFLEDDVSALQVSVVGRRLTNWSLDHRFHQGGFARRNVNFVGFLADFERRHDLCLDHVYVGKMMFGLFAMVMAGEFSEGSVLVALVTGSCASSTARASRQSPALIV